MTGITWEQAREKVRERWPDASCGMCPASLGEEPFYSIFGVPFGNSGDSEPKAWLYVYHECANQPDTTVVRPAFADQMQHAIDHGNVSARMEALEASVVAANEAVASERVTNELLRRRIHLVERHNQYFERCESLYCNPQGTTSSPGADESDRKWLAIPPGDPAKSMRIAALEAQLAAANWQIAILIQPDAQPTELPVRPTYARPLYIADPQAAEIASLRSERDLIASQANRLNEEKNAAEAALQTATEALAAERSLREKAEDALSVSESYQAEEREHHERQRGRAITAETDNTLLRDALKEIIKHHEKLNKRHGRAYGLSNTITLARAALAAVEGKGGQ